MYYKRTLNDSCVHEFSSREIYEDRRNRLLRIANGMCALNDNYQLRHDDDGQATLSFKGRVVGVVEPL